MANLGAIASYTASNIVQRNQGLRYWNLLDFTDASNAVISELQDTTMNINPLTSLMVFDFSTQQNHLYPPVGDRLIILDIGKHLNDNTDGTMTDWTYTSENFGILPFLSNPYFDYSGGDSTTVYIYVDRTVVFDHTYDYTFDYTHWYDASSISIDYGNNIALLKDTTASNTQGGYPASNANDDNTSTYQGAGAPGPTQWIVDLGSIYRIGAMVAYITTDNKRSTFRLNYGINGSDFTVFQDITDSTTHWGDIYTGDFTARYIKVDNIYSPDEWSQQTGINEFMVFPLVDIFHESTVMVDHTSYLFMDDIAINKNATASSTYTGFPASLAVNGTKTQDSWQYSNGAGPQWWMVDLGASYHIGLIRITQPAATTYAWKLSHSLDNTNQVLDATRNYVVQGEQDVYVDMTARYIKLWDMYSPDGWNSFIVVTEVEVFEYAEGVTQEGGVGGGAGAFPVIGGRHIIQVSEIS